MNLLQTAWDKMNGAKTYTAVAGKMLLALSGLIGQAQPLLAAHNMGGLAALLQNAAFNPHLHNFLEALLALGIGHKIAKLVPAPAAEASAPSGDAKAGS
jgi:hypothetical protein